MSEVDTIIDQIVHCEDTTAKLWDFRMEFTRPEKQVKSDDKVRSRVHGIHVVEDRLFLRLWDALDGDLDDFDMHSDTVGGKRRYTFCDGTVHLVTNKQDEFLYGTICDCE